MNSMSEWNLNDCAPELPIKLLYVVPFLPPYLAGLIEGDGTIVVPKEERSPKGKLNYPAIQIVFSKNDFPLVTKIAQIIGHGSISRQKRSSVFIYTINNIDGLIHIVNLINGNMRGPKYNQLLKLINYLNTKKEGLHLIALPLDTSAIGSNSWLTGFIEADGSFQVRASQLQGALAEANKTKQVRLGLSCEITQTRITLHQGGWYSTLELMKTISSFLEVNLEFTREDRKYPQYRIRTSSVKTNIKIRDYLNKYPLQSTKYLDFNDWCEILNWFEQNTHKENKDRIIKIKNQMNQYRTEFNWNHLINSKFE